MRACFSAPSTDASTAARSTRAPSPTQRSGSRACGPSGSGASTTCRVPRDRAEGRPYDAEERTQDMTSQPQPLTATLKRVFAAPIEVVYRAWTDPEQVVQWMKCEPDVELSYEGWVPEVGARFSSTMRKPGAWEATSTGRILEADPPTSTKPSIGGRRSHSRL